MKVKQLIWNSGIFGDLEAVIGSYKLLQLTFRIEKGGNGNYWLTLLSNIDNNVDSSYEHIAGDISSIEQAKQIAQRWLEDSFYHFVKS